MLLEVYRIYVNSYLLEMYPSNHETKTKESQLNCSKVTETETGSTMSLFISIAK